jgi:hypothetical protein
MNKGQPTPHTRNTDRWSFVGDRSSRYALRIIIISVALALATAAAVAFAPRVNDVTVVDNQPIGSGAPLDQPLSVTFSRPIDRRSAERAFVLYPPARERFAWRDDRTIEFVLNEPLKPQTMYNITIRPGLRDQRGRPNRTETRWSFRTR